MLSRQRRFIDPGREVTPPAQSRLVGRPVRDQVTRPRDALATGGVVLEWHGGNIPAPSEAGYLGIDAPTPSIPTSKQAPPLPRDRHYEARTRYRGGDRWTRAVPDCFSAVWPPSYLFGQKAISFVEGLKGRSGVWVGGWSC